MEINETITPTVSGGDNTEPTPTVSGGDNTIIYQLDSALSENITTLLEENNKLLNELNEREESRSETEALTIWNKPLEQYTPEESFDMFVFIAVCVSLIISIIGGIITCN